MRTEGIVLSIQLGLWTRGTLVNVHLPIQNPQTAAYSCTDFWGVWQHPGVVSSEFWHWDLERQFSATWSDRNLSGEALERRVNDVNVFESGRCAVSSRAWCSFFNVMRLGPIVSAKGCCSATFFASKEVPTLVSHGNSLRSIQLNWAFGGLLQYAQEMNWEQKIDSIKKQLNSHSEWCNSCRIRNEVWQSQSRCTSHHAMLHDAPWCT